MSKRPQLTGWSFHGPAPQLDKPVLVAAFSGWNDAGRSATLAAKHYVRVMGAKKVGTLEAEDSYLYTEDRPTIRVRHGQIKSFQWPHNTLYGGQTPSGRSMLVLVGDEPQMKWKSFCQSILDMAQAFEASLIVTLGAYMSDVLYSESIPIHAVSHQLPPHATRHLPPLNYTGDTGIVGALGHQTINQGLPLLGLWAGVPYYISIPNPKATHALVTHLDGALDEKTPTGRLEHAATQFDMRIEGVLEQDPQAKSYLEEIKKRDVLN